MGVGLCFQQLICPIVSHCRGAGGVHIGMKLAMREPFHKTTKTCNAESNLSIQLIGPASV